MIKKAIILAAGMGTRLKPMTLSTHKCLTAICNKTILVNALECLESIDVKEVIIVVGYLADKIVNEIGENYNNITIKYIRNERYFNTNTSYSLKLGIDNVKDYDRLYILEGDVFFEKSLIKRIDNQRREEATLVEEYMPYLDGTFVELDKDGFVIRWTHKNMREEGYKIEDKFKTINIHRFSERFVKEILKIENNNICNNTNGMAPFENVMDIIVKRNRHVIYGVKSQGDKWCEIDDMDDLKRAEKMFGELK